MKRRLLIILAGLFFISACSVTKDTVAIDYSKVPEAQAQKFDTGKMWTFDNPPVEYFENTYNFRPSEEWLNKVRLSALKFANWCSGSFVSEDGLIMTNHHCVDFIIKKIQKEGEDIQKNGFYAKTLEEERKVPGLFVDQLVLIEDVTDEIQMAINKAESTNEKFEAKNKVISEIENRYSKESELRCIVVEFYNGGKYSVYGYKRYNDIRFVFIAESEVGFFGGDPDNFTFPRYSLDCSFLRAYDENGKPLKTKNYFKWSKNGAQLGQPIFVVGNPGSTRRLKTVAQLEYMRDIYYKSAAYRLKKQVAHLNKMIEKHPERLAELKSKLFYTGNSQKVISNVFRGLSDPAMIARKVDFENQFKTAVMKNPELGAKYGHLWSTLENLQNEKRQYGNKINAYSLRSNSAPIYATIAKEVIEFAKQLKMPENKRANKYKSENLEETINQIAEKKYDSETQVFNTTLFSELLYLNLSEDNELVKMLFGGNHGEAAVEYCLNNSELTSADKIKNLLAKQPEDILSSKDPFIQFILKTQDELETIKNKLTEIAKTEEVLENQLGLALFDVYGASIPPDATFTLRISDGLMKSYEYNGTLAPVKTTFYGMFDRFFSFDKKYPWSLPEKWQHPSEEFDLSTTFNFISTNDIVGGSSGSPVINKNREIIGLAFDGNIESIPGSFLYKTEKNRMVSVASQGILEALDDIYFAKRIVRELKSGHIEN